MSEVKTGSSLKIALVVVSTFLVISLIANVYLYTRQYGGITPRGLENQKANYYSIPGSTWLPWIETCDLYRTSVSVYTFTAGNTFWFAPINLPDGAVVTQFNAWVLDNDDDVPNILVSLYRQTASTQQLMASINSIGVSSAYQKLTDSSISYNPIDNQNYAYFAYGILKSGNSNHQLGMVGITYTITEPLP